MNCLSCGDPLPHKGPLEGEGCRANDNTYVLANLPDLATDLTDWAGESWPRVTVVLVSQQKKMDEEDQDLLAVIKSYEEQEYKGPNDLNLVLTPENVEYPEDVMRAVGVKQAEPGIVLFLDDKTPVAPNHLTVVATAFVSKWPEQVKMEDADGGLMACTVGHYMREIYDEVMKSEA